MADLVRGKKRKKNIDERILSKAHSIIDAQPPPQHEPEVPVHDPETEAQIKQILEEGNNIIQVKKIRKPRHMQKKPKPIVTEDETEKKKKRKKKKKKRKSTIPPSSSTSNELTKRPNTEALGFLQRWKECPTEWKFEKLKQTWLLKNCTDKELLPDSLFPIFLEYIIKMKGKAKESTEKDMRNILENKNKGVHEGVMVGGVDVVDDDCKIIRAKEIMQMIISE